MRILAISFLFFFYIYPFALNVFPIGTRSFLAAAGLIFFTIQILHSRVGGRHISRLAMILLAMLPFVLFSVLSAIYNATLDFEFARLALSFTLMYFAAYFLLNVMKSMELEVNIETVSKLIVYAVLIQSLVSFFMYFSPGFQNLVFTHVNFSELALTKMEALKERRVVGFSRSFFGAGIYSGLGLILTGYLLKHYAKNLKDIAWYVTLFLTIFFIGMLMARTTLVGATLGLAYLALPANFSFKLQKNKIKILLVFIFLPLLFISLALILIPGLLDKIYNLLQFGFELFINIFEGKGVQTGSTDALMTMYIWPDNLKTWLIGDGLWDVNNGMGYYMNTDVGYSRMIFYFGIFGLLTFLLYQAFLIKRSFGASFFSLLLF